MRHSSLAILLLVSLGCSPKIMMQYRDSVRVEYRDRVVWDTVTFEITKEVEKVVTRDTSSRLENTYAVSEACVSDGLLYHSLESKPQAISKPVEIHVTDTLIVENATEVITEYKEKKLTRWQRLRQGSFWWLLLAVVITNFKWIMKTVKRIW